MAVEHRNGSLADLAVRRAVAAKEAAARAEVERLLDVTLQLIRRSRGESLPRVTDIVAEAKLSNATFYRHFPSQHELFAAVFEAGAHRLVSYLEHQMAKEEDPRRKLRRWIVGVLAQATMEDVAQETRAVTMHTSNAPGGRPRSLFRAAPRELLLEPLEALGCDHPQRDASVIADAVFERLSHHLWVEPPSKADVEHLVAFCLRAVTGSPDAG